MKKFLLSALALVTVAALAITGTIAWLQDDDSDVNVMTVGNVYIDQHEYERVVNTDGTYKTETIDGVTSYVLKEFTQDKPLLPATEIDANGQPYNYGAGDWDTTKVKMTQVDSHGTMDVFVNKNAQDKFVTVENTGTTDAYVRTLIAFELGTLAKDKFDDVIGTSSFMTAKKVWIVNDLGVYEIDGNNYVVYEYVYNGAAHDNLGGVHANGVLPAGDTTYPSLCQVYMKAAATNADVEALDGNKDGKYNILVRSQAVQVAGFENADEAFGGVTTFAATEEKTAAKVALDIAFGVPEEKHEEYTDLTNTVVWFTKTIEDYEATLTDTWDGTADTTWYNDTDTEFVLDSAEDLAGLAKLVDEGNTFEGKTVTLSKDVDLYAEDTNGEPISFEPIGSYRKDTPFKGIFDGQGHTIANLSQNTWALDNGYYYGDLGLGLFGMVEDATVKNFTIDGASISGESAICGTIAGGAYGDMTFENITVKNAKVNDYLYYAGGVVGWASGNHTYKNINIDASTTIGGQWGDFGNANGGIVGGIGSSAVILFEDCTVACRIDAVNDVVSAYQWYNYRNSGMLVGRVPQTITNGEVQTVATPEHVTCKNVTVIYNDWANYTYCEFAGMGYPYVRVQAGVSVDAYSNVRYGHPTDANGNTVVDDNHVHNAGEAHHELIVFDQLFGGPADHRYCYYGIKAFDGVTVVYNNK